MFDYYLGDSLAQQQRTAVEHQAREYARRQPTPRGDHQAAGVR